MFQGERESKRRKNLTEMCIFKTRTNDIQTNCQIYKTLYNKPVLDKQTLLVVAITRVERMQVSFTAIFCMSFFLRPIPLTWSIGQKLQKCIQCCCCITYIILLFAIVIAVFFVRICNGNILQKQQLQQQFLKMLQFKIFLYNNPGKCIFKKLEELKIQQTFCHLVLKRERTTE